VPRSVEFDLTFDLLNGEVSIIVASFLLSFFPYFRLPPFISLYLCDELRIAEDMD